MRYPLFEVLLLLLLSPIVYFCHIIRRRSRCLPARLRSLERLNIVQPACLALPALQKEIRVDCLFQALNQDSLLCLLSCLPSCLSRR